MNKDEWYSCARKQKFNAAQADKIIGRKDRSVWFKYRCKYCKKYHLTKRQKRGKQTVMK